jgi:hypothetical protein
MNIAQITILIVLALQDAAEVYLADVFGVTVMSKDIQFARGIRGERY